MDSPKQEHALLVDGINMMEVGMLKSLLASEGIPCMVHSPDFDVIELGHAHDMLRGAKLYVPHAALEKAQALLKAAEWSPEDEDEPS
jgi:hypothetical protein